MWGTNLQETIKIQFTRQTVGALHSGFRDHSLIIGGEVASMGGSTQFAPHLGDKHLWTSLGMEGGGSQHFHTSCRVIYSHSRFVTLKKKIHSSHSYVKYYESVSIRG